MANIEDLTIREAREISSLFGKAGENHPYKIGANYLIRTVTMIQAGKLVAVHDKELVLEDASWIADTGRFSDNLLSCEFNEVEPFPSGSVIVGRGAIIDAVQINTAPRTKK